MVLHNSPNVDRFIYLLQNPDKNDPYDLMLRNYFMIKDKSQKKILNKLKDNKYLKSKSKIPLRNKDKLKQVEEKKETIQKYFTISANGICSYVDNKPVDFVSLDEWLK